MKYISGKILTKEGFQKGYLKINENKIIEVEKGISPSRPIVKGLILPTLINMHTHIGDSFIKDRGVPLPRNIEELVAPPGGIKHKLLKEASEKEIITGIKKSIDVMKRNGTKIFCDFRENGISGIQQLKKALESSRISPVILSRPSNLYYNKKEMDLLLENSDGIGLSSISDWDYSEIIKVAKHVKNKKKFFAIHASERVREDIDSILDLKPDFLIHMIKAYESDLIRVKENNIPIVVCTRANSFFGLRPNLDLMKKLGVNILFGTDNAMLVAPNILEEINFVINNFKTFKKSELLFKISYEPRKALNLDCNILSPNSKAEFVVVDEKTLKPLYVSA
ncbi:MAG: hypothetical protein DRO93_14810 [Candidatus Thorarchaeota archaeon]|nr:MAG: hypothetical protein DRO93_14810 [Candidatus Thorarchaeota archaeon]